MSIRIVRATTASMVCSICALSKINPAI